MSTRWGNDPRGPYIRLALTGAKQYLLNPDPAEYDIAAAAWNLAGIKRYNGGGLSVAQHMAVGAALAQRFYPEEKLLPHRFAIHDFPEFCLGDVSSPLKHILGSVYADLEQQHALATESRFNVTFIGDEKVKELDNRMWLTERLIVYREAEGDIDEDISQIELEPFELTRAELRSLFVPWSQEKAFDTYTSVLMELFQPEEPA